MKDAPAFDFYTQRWLAGTMGMTAAERGAYVNLLCHQWEDNGLPAHDRKRLLSMAGCTGKVLMAVLLKFPFSDDGMRRNPRLEVIRKEQRKRIAAAREKSAKMHAARYGGAAASTAASTAGEEHKRATKAALPSPLTTHPVLLEKEPKGAWPRRVPPDPEVWRSYCATFQPAWRPADVDAALDHYTAVGWQMRGGPVKDWKACARNCYRRRHHTGSPGLKPGAGTGPATAKEFMDDIARHRAETPKVEPADRPGADDFKAAKETLKPGKTEQENAEDAEQMERNG